MNTLDAIRYTCTLVPGKSVPLIKALILHGRQAMNGDDRGEPGCKAEAAGLRAPCPSRAALGQKHREGLRLLDPPLRPPPQQAASAGHGQAGSGGIPDPFGRRTPGQSVVPRTTCDPARLTDAGFQRTAAIVAHRGSEGTMEDGGHCCACGDAESRTACGAREAFPGLALRAVAAHAPTARGLCSSRRRFLRAVGGRRL